MNVWGDSIGSEQAAAVLTQTTNVSNASVSMEQALSNVASSSRLIGVDMKDASTAIRSDYQRVCLQHKHPARRKPRYAEDGSAIYKNKQTDE